MDNLLPASAYFLLLSRAGLWGRFFSPRYSRRSRYLCFSLEAGAVAFFCFVL